jgi:hypothetical protein
MTVRALVGVIATTALVGGSAASVAAADANQATRVCVVPRPANGAAIRACTGTRQVRPEKNLLPGQLGGTAQAVAETGVSVASGAAVAAIGLSVLGGAKFALRETAVVLGDTSSPQLTSTWFSSTYWRVAGISVLLTLPFLFAAAVHAVLRSDLTLLLRAAFGYLPLAMLAVSIAAPVTMLLLAASDQLSAIVSSATGNASNRFINFSVGALSGLSAAAGPFMALFLGVFVVAGAVVLWVELLMREAAVYVIVLMLPLAFAGMVWPARRIWAIRAVELLVALVMSKFAIVAVLSLGAAALSAGATVAGHSVTSALAGAVLLIMGAFTPWALLRLLPLAEVASSAAGSLSRETRAGTHAGRDLAGLVAHSAPDWAADMTARMQRDASGTTPAPPATDASGTTPGPPAASEDSADESQSPPPQGGPGVATRDAEEPARDEEVQYDTSDVGIDEMWKPENKGRWRL